MSIEKLIKVKADLHLHTTASDGKLTPEELVRKAAAASLDMIAITDHDTVEAIAPALREIGTHPGLRLIPGVEVSTDVPHGEVHVLGYFLDHNDRELVSNLAKLKSSRVVRAERMVEKLAGLGLKVDWGRVREIAGEGSIGRPHIAEALYEKGLVTSIREAFDKYISRDGPAYVERDKMTPEEAVELLVRSRGLPVLAHPGYLPDLESLLIRLQRVGLVGLEAYYDGYDRRLMGQLASLASKYNLVATGGSDFHGFQGDEETQLGGVPIPPECIHKLLVIARQSSLVGS